MAELKVIMVVDDNETDQFLNEVIIEKFDPSIQVVKAYDGQEALDYFSRNEAIPDIVFLDINMPGMNGFQFLEQFDTSIAPSVKIFMLSSSEQDDDKEKALSYDVVKEYLPKPMCLIGLEALIERYF